MIELVERIRDTVQNGWRKSSNPRGGEPGDDTPARSPQRTAAKLLAGFFGLMLLFTILSRAADAMTVAKVQVASPRSGALSYEVEAQGQIESSKELSLAAQQGLRVQDVFVEAGQQVQAGDPLVGFDVGDIDEQLRTAQDALEKLNLQLKQQKLTGSSGATAVDTAEQSLDNAKGDYDAALRNADKTIARAQQDLSQATIDYQLALSQAQQASDDAREQAIASAQAAVASSQSAVDAAGHSRQEALTAAGRAVEDAQAALSAAEASGDEAAIAAAKLRLQRAQEDQSSATAYWDQTLEKARQALAQAQAALAAAQSASGGSSAQTIQSSRKALEAAQRALQDAVESKREQEIASGRAIETAQNQLETARKSASDSAAQSSYQQQSLAIDIRAKEREIAELAALRENSSLTAPEDAIVVSVAVTVGQRTGGEEVAHLAATGHGYKFRAQLSEEQAEKVSLGDEVQLFLDDTTFPLKVSIASLNVNRAQKTAEVTANLPEGAYAPGEGAKMSLTKRSKNYQACLPLAAVRRDNAGDYVLVVRESESVLGKELTLARINVTVADSDATTAALSGGLDAKDRIVTSANKPVGAGDRVRLDS